MEETLLSPVNKEIEDKLQLLKTIQNKKERFDFLLTLVAKLKPFDMVSIWIDNQKLDFEVSEEAARDITNALNNSYTKEKEMLLKEAEQFIKVK